MGTSIDYLTEELFVCPGCDEIQSITFVKDGDNEFEPVAGQECKSCGFHFDADEWGLLNYENVFQEK